MTDMIDFLLRLAKTNSVLAENEIKKLIPVWRPIAEAPIPPYLEAPSYYRYRALIQTEEGDVFGGWAGWANSGKGQVVRWYSSHGDRWVRDAKYFMPMPAPRID